MAEDATDLTRTPTPGVVRSREAADRPSPVPDWSGARFLVGDVFDRLAELSDASVDVLVTSPPFLALRSYLPADHPDKAKEIGSEPTPAAFLDTLLDLTAEWRRVLAPHGSICVELGDSYSGSGGSGGDYNPGGLREGQAKWMGTGRSAKESSAKIPWKGARPGWPMAKSLCGVPTLYPWSLAYGRNLLNPEHTVEPWRVRNLIAWTRPNPPVGALGDKVRPATSYITVACAGSSRYFDLDGRSYSGHRGNPGGAPPLDWWEIPTQPYTGSHYATMPEEIPRRLISLMCPQRVCLTCGRPSERVVEAAVFADGQPSRGNLNGRSAVEPWRDETATHQVGRATFSRVATTLGWTDCGHNDWRPGTVLDPFAGSGTTLAVAVGMGRRAIGIDIDERNAHLAEQRVGMFLEVVA